MPIENCGSHLFGGVQIHGGKDNIVRNNLLVNCANTFLRKPAATKPENTVEIQAENVTLESVLQNREWFEKNRIPEIPWEKIGRKQH